MSLIRTWVFLVCCFLDLLRKRLVCRAILIGSSDEQTHLADVLTLDLRFIFIRRRCVAMNIQKRVRSLFQELLGGCAGTIVRARVVRKKCFFGIHRFDAPRFELLFQRVAHIVNARIFPERGIAVGRNVGFIAMG